MPTFQNKTRCVKKNYSFNNSRRQRMILIAVKNLSALLTKITKHDGGLYCLNGLYSFRTKIKTESYKKSKMHVMLLFDDAKILELNQYHKSDKARFIIYADIESLI